MSKTEDGGDAEHIGTRIRDPELKDALDDAEDEHGSKSEALRNAIREAYVDGDEIPDAKRFLPDDPEVQRGYQILREEAAPYTHRVDADTAKSRIANRLNIPKSAVKRRIILPLKRQRVAGESVVEPIWGVLKVRQPDELEALAAAQGGDDGE